MWFFVFILSEICWVFCDLKGLPCGVDLGILTQFADLNECCFHPRWYIIDNWSTLTIRPVSLFAGKAEASNNSIWLYDQRLCQLFGKLYGYMTNDYANYLVNFTSDPIFEVPQPCPRAGSRTTTSPGGSWAPLGGGSEVVPSLTLAFSKQTLFQILIVERT